MINYSFIIPHHNTPYLLDRLLKTIPQRNDIEVIIVDDNSDHDKKPRIIRKDVLMVYLTPEESKGAGHARNIGLKLSKGKWLLFADSDDYYEENFISLLDAYIDSEADIVLFNAYVDFDPINPKLCKEINYIDEIIQKYLSSPKTDKDMHRAAMTANVPWNKMYKHSFIIDIKAFFEEIPISNDAWFVKYAGAYAKKIEIINKKLYYYVKYSNNITNKKRPLNHYFLAIDSNTRRNILLSKMGLNDLIEFPGFNKANILRDFGRITFVKLVVYKMFHDPTYLRSIFSKLFR